MSSTSASSKERAAEFARLLQFFDHLASRGKKVNLVGDGGSGPKLQCDEDSTHPHSTESNTTQLLEYATNLRLTPAGTTTTKRPRRSTVSGTRSFSSSTASSAHSEMSTTSSTSTESSGEISVAKFPLRKQRPFTFRLGLHKLYERHDWIKKVRESLEQSKREYKPLAEYLEDVRREKVAEETTRAGAGVGRVHFASGLGHPGGSPRNAPSGRPRSISAASHSLMTSKTLAMEDRDDSAAGAARPAKKRCIGRRKSVNGPLNAQWEDQENKIGEMWVYDALVSQLGHEHYRSGEWGRHTQNVAGPQQLQDGSKASRRRISLSAVHEGKGCSESGVGAGISYGERRGARRRAFTGVSLSTNVEAIRGQVSLKRPFGS